MSGESRTPVTVTLPTRGSLTSRAISSASTRCSSDSILRWRPEPPFFTVMIRPPPELFQGPGHLETRKALDLIADAHVLVVLHTDAALRPGAHLADVVLEAAQ